MLRLLVASALLAICLSAAIHDSESEDEDWKDFKRKYGKKYKNKEDEKNRRGLWRKNKHMIDKHNKDAKEGKYSYTEGVNQFADWNQEEFNAILGSRPSTRTREASHFVSRSDEKIKVSRSDEKINDTVDWRDKGYVTPVKDQGRCGSCWAFSATGTLEGQWFKIHNELVSFSEQDLVDCSNNTNGCEGGFASKALDDIRAKGGIATEVSYPYEAVEGECRFKNATVGAKVKGTHSLSRSGDEDELKAIVANNGPVSVSINGAAIRFYKGGVYDNSACSQKTSHAVLIIGYGTEKGKSYWLVKNSWNETWGERGYIKMSRNKQNQCGIAKRAHWPELESKLVKP